MKHVALVCKLMPLYRLGIFHELSLIKNPYKFTCFGDTKKEAGIEIIPWSLANDLDSGGVNWVKTKNYFYISEKLLWQTGIIKRIFSSKYEFFIFEGASLHLPTWLFAVLCRLSGKKVLFWTHGFKGFDKGLKKLIRTCYFKLADALLLYGQYSKDLMLKSGFKENKLFIIYNSLDSTKQLEFLKTSNYDIILKEKNSLFIRPELLTVIFIGRLVKSKNIPFLLNAVKDFSQVGNPINCIIIGNGPEMDGIKSFTMKNNLQNYIHITGALHEEALIGKYFMMSDLMVSPGNVGLNCIHSLAYGVPVLTHNNLQFQGPEVEAIISGVTGLLFEHNNYEDMLVKLRDWQENRLTKAQISIKCQKVILNQYNPVKQAEYILNAIESL
ncbi:MAG: glycosyltransferase [Bacteroidota bacterium]|nr:glycosyltransferase [Bacteroidota bacterium]